MTQPGIEPRSFRPLGEHSTHLVNDASTFLRNIMIFQKSNIKELYYSYWNIIKLKWIL